jgi:hypothetical protein
MRMAEIDFLIIGAAKSATTWLQHSLQREPSIYMPDPELHYFSRQFQNGQDWYLGQFDKSGSHQTVGEKSNSYLEKPEAAQRIRNALPDVKLIVQLRNPIERAYSDYCMLLRRGEVGKDIERYLDPRHSGGGRFLAGGRYFHQLKVYLDLFKREQLLILFYEDVKSAPQQQLDHIHGFLQLDPKIQLRPLEARVKDKATPILPLGLRKAVKPLKPILSPFRKNPIMRALHSSLAQPETYPALHPDLCLRMLDYYAPDTERLGALVGEDLSGWLRNVRGLPKDARLDAEAPAFGRAINAMSHRTGLDGNSHDI